jgi:hypothetical protein
MEWRIRLPVRIQPAAPRTLAAVQACLPAHRVLREFGRYLDQVYAARAAGIPLDGQNIFLYRDAKDPPGHLVIEFGVGVTAPFTPLGAVRPVDLPVGDVATTTHRGPYAGLGAAHDAVIAWCRSQGRALAGPRWEVYGHWTGEEAEPITDIYYLLEPVPA